MRWYPASFNRPKTAFTFDILETYHKVTLQGKLNLYDFYHAIMHKTDNQGRSKPLVSTLDDRNHFLLMEILIVSLSRNLPVCPSVEEPKGRKTRGWCTPNASPIRNGTWILCGRVSGLSSPRAQPSGGLEQRLWCQRVSEFIKFLERLADSLSRWIYAQFIAVDANFKLKLKNRRIEDPELGSGWSYFVEASEYARHIARNPHEKDVRARRSTHEPRLTPTTV